MKAIIDLCAIVAIAMVMAGCSMDSAQLGEYVKKEMQEELVKTEGLKALKMREVRLLKGDGIEYYGVGKGEIDGHIIKFDVKCKYDGKTVLWDANIPEDDLLVLATKEKAKGIYDKIKAAWPGVKTDIKQKYEAASKKAGEYYDAASKKVEQGIDSVRGAIQGESGKSSPDRGDMRQ